MRQIVNKAKTILLIIPCLKTRIRREAVHLI